MEAPGETAEVAPTQQQPHAAAERPPPGPARQPSPPADGGVGGRHGVGGDAGGAGDLGRSGSAGSGAGHRQIFPDDEQDAAAYDDPLYATDSFRLNCFKILPCSKRYTHDWVRCPFAHPGEKARRRPLSSKSYSATMCPEIQRSGACPRGDACGYAHNVFEHWLHHDRYRTQMCRDGPGCSRKVCFFAHTIEELRTPSGTPPPTQPAPALHPGLQAHLSQTGQYASGGLPYACAPLSQGGSSSCFPPTPLDGGAPGGLVFAAAEDYPEGGPVAYMHGGGLDFPNSALLRGSPLEAAAAAGYQYIPAGGGGGGGGYIAVPALGGAMGVAGYLHAPAAAVLAAGGQAQYRQQQQQQGGIMLMGGPRGHPSVMMVAAHPDAHHHHHHHQADGPAGAGQAHAHAQAQAAATALAAQLSLSGGGGGPGQQSGAPMMRLVPLGADGAQQGGVPAHGGWVLAPQHGARGGGHYGVGGGGQF